MGSADATTDTASTPDQEVENLTVSEAAPADETPPSNSVATDTECEAPPSELVATPVEGSPKGDGHSETSQSIVQQYANRMRGIHVQHVCVANDMYQSAVSLH